MRTIKFDYQALSPDALHLFPAIHPGCFLNENLVAEPVPDLSVGKESQLVNSDADQYPAEKTNSAPDSQGLIGENRTESRLSRSVLLKPGNLEE